MKNISILGCGWLGIPLAKALLKKGYTVKGTTTTNEKLPELSAMGITPYLVDISSETIEPEILNSDVIIILITSKNSDDFKRLIKGIASSPLKQVLFISSTSVYPSTNTVITEDSPTIDSPLATIENLFRTQSSFNTTIIRFGGLFGYQRQAGNFIRPHNRIPNPEGFVNLIHQDDCIGILVSILEQHVWDDTFNACADSHPRRFDFYAKEMAKVGRLHPVLDVESTNTYKIISPQKLISRIHYTFKYPDLMAY